MFMPSILSDNFIDDMFDSFFTRPTKDVNSYSNIDDEEIVNNEYTYMIDDKVFNMANINNEYNK